MLWVKILAIWTVAVRSPAVAVGLVLACSCLAALEELSGPAEKMDDVGILDAQNTCRNFLSREGPARRLDSLRRSRWEEQWLLEQVRGRPEDA